METRLDKDMKGTPLASDGGGALGCAMVLQDRHGGWCDVPVLQCPHAGAIAALPRVHCLPRVGIRSAADMVENQNSSDECEATGNGGQNRMDHAFPSSGETLPQGREPERSPQNVCDG